MKRIIAFLLAVFPALASAQEATFFVDDDALVWRKVYDGSTTSAIVSYNLQASGFFRNIQASDNLVTAEMYGVSLDYKGKGYKQMSLPIYVVNNTFSGFVSVQIKENRYRVTVMRMLSHNQRLGTGPLETLAVKDGVVDPKFLDPAGVIIDDTFDGLFSELDKNDMDDEW